MIRAALIFLPFTALGQCDCIGDGTSIVILPDGAYIPRAIVEEIADTATVWKNGNEVGIRAIQFIASQALTIKAKDEQHAAEVDALVTANKANVQEAKEQGDRADFAEKQAKRKGKALGIATAIAVVEGAWIVGTNIKRP